ncbi:hypothetical protein BH09MYX1_BH09MYX1_61700 [soil metagenome]
MLDRAEHRFSTVAGVEILLARRALKRGAVEDAEARLVTLTEGADGRYHATAWAWLGVARLAQGDRDGAERAAREALSRDGREAVARFVLVKLARKL